MSADATRRSTVRVQPGRHAKRPSSRLRRFAAAVTALAIGVIAPLTGAAAAEAAVVGSVQTKFEIDGNMAGTDDWAGISAGTYGPYVTASGDPSTGIIAVSSGTEYCVGGTVTGSDQSTFTPGQKIDDSSWTIQPGNVNEKSDLCSTGSAYEIVDVDGEYHVILYQYWTRSASGTGDLTVYQELLGPNSGSRTDDALIQFDYNASGGGSVDVSALTWNGSAWVEGTTTIFQAATGRNGATGNVGTFGESAVDLTASGILSTTACESLTTGRAISRTGNNASANLEDVMSGGPGFTINNCGSLTVQKVVQGTAPAGLTFDYIIDQAGTPATAIHGPTRPAGDTDTSPTSITSSIAAGGSTTWTNLIAQPDYRVGELVAGLPAGVTGLSVVCTYQSWFEAGRPLREVTVWQNGSYTGNVLPIFPSSIGATTPTCVITNQVTSLTLDKIVTNDNGGTASSSAFTLTATPTAGGAAVINGSDTNPAAGSTLSAVVAPASYTLSESSLAGYTGGAWSCVGGTRVGSVITVPQGASVVCAVTNDDQPATLTLVKDVTNNSGGRLADTAFTLTASGPTPLSGTETSAAVTDAPVSAGVYTIGEVPQPGYTVTGVACWTDSTRTTTVAVSDTRTISLANGGTAFCEISNDDQPGALTLIKNVTTDDGGTATATQWTLTATGPTPGVSGAGGVSDVAVDAGEYVLSESAGPAGYTPSAWSCDLAGSLDGSTVTVPLGTHVTCQITNDDVAPGLTLVKQVINDDGGTSAVDDWQLTADGPGDPISGTTADWSAGVQLVAGTYELSETSARSDDYTASAWVCTGNGTESTGTSITLRVGQSAVCTITNDDIAPRLTLLKTVVNDDGGSALDTAWTLNAVGPSAGVTGIEGADAITDREVRGGEYTLSETGGPAGYTAIGWVCTEGSLDGAVLTLDAGDAAVCTITNDDVQPTLALVKTVTNDNGGTQLPTAWTLTADGPDDSDLSGAGGVAATAVDAGRYTLGETGPTGYSPSAWSCTDGALVGSTLTLAPGDTAVCTIANNDIQPRITLVKQVVNDEGGDATPPMWTLTAAGPGGPVTGLSGTGATTDVAVNAGTFTLSEAPSPGADVTGYTAGAWDCTVGEMGVGTVTLLPGQSTICTIINDDEPIDLQLTKDDGGFSGANGDEFDYAITVTNGGARDADLDEPVTVTDVLPDGVSLVSSTDCWVADAATPQVIACDIDPAQLGSGDSVVLTLTVMFDADAPAGSYVNLAWVTTEDDPAPAEPDCESESNNVDCEETPLVFPTLTLVKVLDNAGGGSAMLADFPLSAVGPTSVSGVGGTGAVTGVAVPAGTYELSEQMLAQGYTAGDWGCTGAATMEDIETGETWVTIVGTVSVTCTIMNSAEPVDLELAKDDGGFSGANGDQFDYTLTVDNLGERDADPGEPVTVTDVLPEGVSFVSSTDCAIADPATPQVVTCSIDPADLQVADAPVVLTITAMFDADAPAGSYVNLAWVTTEDDPAPEEPTCESLSNNVDCERTPLEFPTLTLIKLLSNDDGGDATLGDFTLTATGPVTISGFSGESGEVWQRAVPAGAYVLSETELAGYTASGWSCLGAQAVTDEQGVTTVTIVGTIDVTCTIENDDEPVDLQLTKDDGGATGANGDSFDYTITVSSIGARDADLDEPVTVTDVLPDGVSFVSSADCSVADPATPQTVTCSIDPTDLEVGDAPVVLTLTVMFDADAPAGSYVNLAWVTTEDDPAPAEPDCESESNNVDCEETPLVFPTLTLVKALDNGDGGNATVSDFPLTAAGPTLVTGVSGTGGVTGVPVPAGDYLLSEEMLDGYLAGDWTCEGAEPMLDEETGETWISIVGIVDVTCRIANDDQPVDLQLTKDDDGMPHADGDEFDYTITVSNAGDRDVDGDEPVTITDTLPDGVAYVDGPEECEAVGQVITCDIAPEVLQVGDEPVVLTLTVMFDADAVEGVYENIAWVTTEDDPAPDEPVCPADDSPLSSSTDNVDCEETELVFPTLTLVKLLPNDDGGDATLADFPLTAAGPTTVTGVSGTEAVTGVPVPAGDYLLSEEMLEGYTASDWSCVGAEAKSDGETGETRVPIVGLVDVTCTITNDDEPVDLELTKDDGGLNAAAGGEFDYTITVTNVGDRPTDDDETVTVVDELPDGFSFVDGPETCTAEGQTVTCDVDPALLLPGESVVIVLTIAIAPATPPGTYVNFATVTTGDDELPAGSDCESQSNNVDCEPTPVFQGTVAGVKSAWEMADGAWVAADGTVDFGDEVQYRIVVTAAGEATSTGVVVVDKLQDGLVSANAATCSVTCTAIYDALTSTHRIEIATMMSGDAVTITFLAKVPPAPAHAAGTTVSVSFHNVASVASDIVPATPTNEVVLEATHILAPPPQLPRTGGDLPTGIIGLALALMIGGGLLLIRRRRVEPRA